MIGCGGGTLGTMLAKAGRLVTDRRYQSGIDRACAAVFLFAYDVACHVEDGAIVSASAAETLRCDRHRRVHAATRVPHHLCSMEFFQLVRQRLATVRMCLPQCPSPPWPRPQRRCHAGRMADAGFEVRVLEFAGTDSSATPSSWVAPWQAHRADPPGDAGGSQDEITAGARTHAISKLAGASWNSSAQRERHFSESQTP